MPKTYVSLEKCEKDLRAYADRKCADSVEYANGVLSALARIYNYGDEHYLKILDEPVFTEEMVERELEHIGLFCNSLNAIRGSIIGKNENAIRLRNYLLSAQAIITRLSEEVGILPDRARKDEKNE